MELLELLNEPPREFTPIPFWFLNGNLTKKELRRQLMDFHNHGVYGVVLHPRIGLPRRIGYLGKEFFSYLSWAVETAAQLEMKIVLYDEGMYPSGSACGLVVKGHPQLASRGIALVEEMGDQDRLLAVTPKGMLVERRSGGTLRGIHWGEDDGEPYAPASADILNPKAVDRFIALTHEAYYRNLKPYFGKTVIGFFTDEPSILGRNTEGMFPWTAGFAEMFSEAGGKLEDLAALFSGESNASTALYQKLILQREGEVYYRRLSCWCESHGIALMGHPHQSDDIEVEKYFHIPGQDLVLRWVAPETGGVMGIDSTMAKCSADAAAWAGRRRNSNECFGACNKDDNPWQLSGGDMKWYLDWLAVRGVNLFIPHAFYYSISGKRKAERPPDVGPNSIWWPYYQKWSLYMRRLSCLMTDCSLYARTAVLCRNRDLKPEEVRPLLEQQIGFRYLPESLWNECRVENGELTIRGQCFHTVWGGDDKFSQVSHRLPEDAERDCICTPPQKELRTARFMRAGVWCWLLVNEGSKRLETTITLPVKERLGQYDLWEGKAWKSGGQAVDGGTELALVLEQRESVLLFVCAEETYARLPEREEFRLPAPSFVLQEENRREGKKRYTACLQIDGSMLLHQHLTIAVEAEEMAELEINGVLAGVGFWPPQVFDLTGLLNEGENQLTLTVTGSLANRYGRKPVWYGVRQ